MKKQGVFFYILILAPVAVVALLIFILLPLRPVETAVVELPAAVGSPAADEPDRQVFDRLIAVTPESVQTVIKTLSRADSYSRTLTETLFWNGGSRVTTVSVWKDGENARINVSAPSEPTKNVLLRGDGKWIWYSDSSRVFHSAARERDEDAYQALLSYEKVLDLDVSDITDAGYGDFDGEKCIFVRYRSGSLGYESILHVSVETGLVMGDETYDGDKLIYSMVSSAVDISTPESGRFAVPEGAS